MRTRMVGFATQAGRLRHIVRPTAREIGKRVDLELQGADVEMDRTVLDRMIGPFEHMIRNSIDHGIETADVRTRAGKAAEGRITIAVAQEGAEIVISFSDDGAGLNLPAIRAKAVERGLMAEGASLTDDELIQFILLSGFSTASKITHVSGRGVGMDVVHSEVKQLGGSMSVSTERGAGHELHHPSAADAVDHPGDHGLRRRSAICHAVVIGRQHRRVSGGTARPSFRSARTRCSITPTRYTRTYISASGWVFRAARATARKCRCCWRAPARARWPCRWTGWAARAKS